METQITNYQELQDAVAAYLIREDLTTEIKVWITLWEREINGLIRCRKQEKRTETETTATDDILSVPSDFLLAKLVKIGSTVLEPLTLQTQQDKYGDATQGKPKSFSVYGVGLLLLPDQDKIYTVDLYYVSKIPTLSNTNTSNWLLRDYPFLYLYGVLLQAQPYVKNPEEVSLWQGFISDSVSLINRQEFLGKYGTAGATVRYSGVVV